MLYLRPAEQRGKANFGWLDSKHSFSFGNYYDPAHMGFSVLRVINDDTVAPGAGFGTHGHRDMEIISYVTDGVIAHKDSMGNEFKVPAGDVQRMSAGTGVTHSEYNASDSEALKFLQIWIQPAKTGIEPGYEQKAVEQNGALTALVNPDGSNGALSINQDASMSRLALEGGASQNFDLGGRAGYLHVLEGEAVVEGHTLAAADGIGVQQDNVQVRAGDVGLVALWFDLPPIPDRH